MANEINTKLDPAVVKILKQGLKPGDKIEAMVKAGVPRNQVALFMYRLEHVADPTLVIPATPASIKNARLNDKLRFERIAYRTGLADKHGSLGAGISKAKELMKKAGADPEAYVGRGRRFDGSKPVAGATSGRRGSGNTKPAATSGRRGAAAPAATSGRRGAGAGKPAAGRRGTRAQADPK